MFVRMQSMRQVKNCNCRCFPIATSQLSTPTLAAAEAFCLASSANMPMITARFRSACQNALCTRFSHQPLSCHSCLRALQSYEQPSRPVPPHMLLFRILFARTAYLSKDITQKTYNVRKQHILHSHPAWQLRLLVTSSRCRPLHDEVLCW